MNHLMPLRPVSFNRVFHALSLTLAFACTHTTRASTQHYIGEVQSGHGAGATVISTQISYISPRPDVGNPEMYKPNGARAFSVDGWFCTRETFLDAVQPGQRLHLRNNRHQPVLYNLFSTPSFAAEGILIKADPDSRTVTVRHMIDRRQRKTVEQTFTLPVDGVLRYEGRDVSPEEALKPGRHVRAHSARPQTVLAITPEARLDTVAERAAGWPLLREPTWINEGVFAGYYHNKLFFTGEPFRGGGDPGVLRDTYQPGGGIAEDQFTAYTLINGNFVAARAAFRPGERVLILPDPIHSRHKASHIIFQPRDDGHIEGKVLGVDGNRLELRIGDTPTGRARDWVEKTVVVPLEDDAVYHLNGKPGASRSETLRVGNTVRVLPAWSGALLVRDMDATKAGVSGYGIFDRATHRVEQPFTGQGPARVHLRFRNVLITPLNPEQYVDATFDWEKGDIKNLRVFNGRFKVKWSVEQIGAHLEINGSIATGWVEGTFTGGTLGGYGKEGVYRFEFSGDLRNNVISGTLDRILIDGVDSEQVDKGHSGQLDFRFGGTVFVGRAEGQTGIHRLVLAPRGHEVYLARTEQGWGEALAIHAGNRKGDPMAVDPGNLGLTDEGLKGPLPIELASELLPNVSEAQWRIHHITVPFTGDPDTENTGEYRLLFGDDPVLWIGPEDSIHQE